MSDPNAWPVVDVGERLDRLTSDLLHGEIHGHRLVDEDGERDEFGNQVGGDAGRLA